MSDKTQAFDNRKTRQWRMINMAAGAMLLTYCLVQSLLAAGGAQ